MSQVKKLQNGGTTQTFIGVKPFETKELPELNFQKTTTTPGGSQLGSLTIDGVRYDATPEFIQDLSSRLAGTTTLGGLTAALQRGEHLSYDSTSNTITGMDGKWTGITARQDRKRDVGASQWRRNWQATLNTDAHRFRNDLQRLAGYRFGNGSSATTTTANPLDIYGDRLSFAYNTNEDGTKSYLQNSQSNIAIDQRLDRMSAYLDANDDNVRKGYRLAEYWTPQRMDALQSLYDSNRTTWSNTINEIRRKARAGEEFTPDEIAFLENFNIGNDVTSAGAGYGTSKPSAKDKQKWLNAGYNESLINLLYPRAVLNDDGSISLRDGESWGWDLGEYNGRNLEFNDSFYQTSLGATGGFDPYKGLTLYNNRLYGSNNAALGRILNASGGYNERMQSGDWAGANNIILTHYLDNEREIPASLANDKYSEFLSDKPSRRYSDLTGVVSLTNPNNFGYTKDDQIIQYVDLDANEFAGPYRRYNYKYALLDKDGKFKANLNQSDLQKIVGGKARETGLQTKPRVVSPSNKAYNGKVYEDITTRDQGETGFRIYTDPKDPNGRVILHMPKIKAAGMTKDMDLELPPEVAKILMSDKDLWNKVTRNAQTQKDFVEVMSRLVQSRLRQKASGNWVASLIGPLGLIFNPPDRAKLRRIGFRDETLEALNSAIKSASRGSKQDRVASYIVTSPFASNGKVASEKNGGTLQKLQRGGFAGGSKNAIGVSELRTNTTSTNPNNSAGVLEVGNENWTDADTADMAALVADLGSLATAFIPGANIASVATGATGSTARLYADLQRGTKGAIPNYLLNLGMDATMLLPIAGGVVKAARIPRAVAKALPTIIKAASVYGLGAGVVDTAKKIASGEKFTVRDVDVLVNALTAGVGLKKSGGFGKSKTKVVKTEPITLSGKNGTKDIKLSAEELKDIDTPEKLFDSLFAEAKKSNKELTKEMFNEQYDVNSLLQTTRKWKPGWNPKTWFNKEETNVFKPKTTKTKESVKANGNSFHDWWYGVGAKQQGYNAQLRGETPKQTVTKAYELKRTDTDVYPTKPRIFRKKGIVTSREIPLSEYKGRSFTGEVTPGGFTTLGQGPGMVQNPGTASYTGYISRRTTSSLPLQGIALPQWINPFTAANNQLNEESQPAGYIMRPVYKKGGVVKAQDGNQLKSVKEAQEWLAKSKEDDWNKVGEGGPGTADGGFNGTALTFDLNPVLNGLRAGISSYMSDKQLKNWLNRPRYHMDYPLFNAPRFIDSGQGDAYDNAAKKLLITKPVTSDAVVNEMALRQRQADATQLGLQADLARSQEFGKYKSGLDEFINKNKEGLTNINNQNRHFDWTHDIEDVQMRNSNIAEKSKFWDQFGYSTQDWYNRQHELKNSVLANRDFTEKAQQVQDIRNQRVKELDAKYTDKTSQAYLSELNQIGLDYSRAIQSLQLEASKVGLVYPFRQFVAKGGKVGKQSAVTYSRDPYPELLLQNAKSSTRLVEKLNDSVIRLILQTKPKDVS